MRVYNCARDHKMRLMQLFPLGLHSHGMRATHLFVRKVLQGCCKKTVQGDSFWTTEDAVPHWPRLDVCRPRRGGTLNSRRLLCSRFTGDLYHNKRNAWSVNSIQFQFQNNSLCVSNCQWNAWSVNSIQFQFQKL